MSRALALATLILFLFPAAAILDAAVPRTLRAASGQLYTSLEDWSRGQKLSLFLERGAGDYSVAGRNRRLVFRVNSQRVEIDGVLVHLSFPILAGRDGPYVAVKDVDHVLDPIVQPRKESTWRLRTIALDAGHGGKDSGYHTERDFEKEHTLALAREVRERLQKLGFRVVMIREADTFVPLEERPLIARRLKADLFVSLHFNSAGPDGREVRGCETYVLAPLGTKSTHGGNTRSQVEKGHAHGARNILLAHSLQKQLVARAGLADRGVKRAWFVVLREAEMPAVLIELGFMSNPEDLQRIRSTTERGRMAQAIADGIAQYKTRTEP